MTSSNTDTYLIIYRITSFLNMIRSDERTHEDDLSEGCTEDALIGSRASSQSVSSTSTANGSKRKSNKDFFKI